MIMTDKNPVISVKDGKICINGRTFEHDELRESINKGTATCALWPKVPSFLAALLRTAVSSSLS